MNSSNLTQYESILRSAADMETQGDCASALARFEEALKLDHERPDAYLKAAEMILRHSGVWSGNKQLIPPDRAVQYLEDGLSWSPDNMDLLKLLYHAQVHAGQLHRAVQTAAKLVERSPDKAHWREQGRKTLTTLEQSPQIALLRMSLGPQAIDNLRRMFSNIKDTSFGAIGLLLFEQVTQAEDGFDQICGIANSLAGLTRELEGTLFELRTAFMDPKVILKFPDHMGGPTIEVPADRIKRLIVIKVNHEGKWDSAYTLAAVFGIFGNFPPLFVAEGQPHFNSVLQLLDYTITIKSLDFDKLESSAARVCPVCNGKSRVSYQSPYEFTGVDDYCRFCNGRGRLETPIAQKAKCEHNGLEHCSRAEYLVMNATEKEKLGQAILSFLRNSGQTRFTYDTFSPFEIDMMVLSGIFSDLRDRGLIRGVGYMTFEIV